VRVLRRARMVGSSAGGGEVAEGAIVALVVLVVFRKCVCYDIGRIYFVVDKSSLWRGRFWPATLAPYWSDLHDPKTNRTINLLFQSSP
jgi:hypothetical protein